ncbi:MAG: class I SAM-dependent methyltransferase [Lacipirellulaceae bacterium]
MQSATSRSREDLIATLREIDRTGDDTWLANVEDRKAEEARFHDEKVDRHGKDRDAEDLQEKSRGNKRFYSTVEKSKQHTLQWISSHSPGKVVLDYACGQGSLAMHAARSGADLAIGLDISRTSILNARSDAKADGLEGNTFFLQGDCEATGLPDDSVDVMICSGMLHHLNVEEAFPEMCRVLKPGGVCLAIEALDYNPIVKAYRLLTPGLRTEWEKHHILSHDELQLSEHYFDVKNVRYWHLASIAASVLRKTPLFRPALSIGNAIDAVILRIPLIRRMAWQFSFELHKPAVSQSKQRPTQPSSRQAA